MACHTGGVDSGHSTGAATLNSGATVVLTVTEQVRGLRPGLASLGHAATQVQVDVVIVVVAVGTWLGSDGGDLLMSR